MKQDKMCKFSRKSSFSSYVEQKNKQLIQLILCQLDTRRLVEEKGQKNQGQPLRNQKETCFQ